MSFLGKLIANIKNYALIVLGALAAFGMFMWQMTRARLSSAKLKGEKRARKTEQKDIKATIEGLENENKIINSGDIDPDHFS